MRQLASSMTIVMALCFCSAASAEVVFEYVTVGDPSNAGELSGAGAGGFGPDRICGTVNYAYRIAKYEVTNAQYIEFLNAVAQTDAYGLYHADMDGTFGGIARSGGAGSYSYGPKDGDVNWLNRPVNFISFWDAARFANWIHNSQPTGVQEAGTTEDGAYTLNGIISSAGADIVRNLDAMVFIPSEDEWYKAAYYDPSLNGGSGGYWEYPTRSNLPPTPEPPPGTNMVNGSATYWLGFYMQGPPYYTPEVGAYTGKPSDSAYGTFDQGAGQWEWFDSIVSGSSRGIRGGSYYTWDTRLAASWRVGVSPDFEDQERGFRLATLFCGDNAIDPGEDCDGTLDSACPGECASTCRCPSTCSVVDPPTSDAADLDIGFGTRGRYITFTPGNYGELTALRVGGAGWYAWVGGPIHTSENSGVVDPASAPGFPVFYSATLQCEPYYANWAQYGTVHVWHEAIVPGETYSLQAIGEACDQGIEGNYSPPLQIPLTRWGDVCGILNSTLGVWMPPDGGVDMTTDTIAILDKFRNLPNAPTKTQADLEPAAPNLIIDISDVTRSVDAFRGLPYPFPTGVIPCGATGSTP